MTPPVVLLLASRDSDPRWLAWVRRAAGVVDDVVEWKLEQERRSDARYHRARRQRRQRRRQRAASRAALVATVLRWWRR